MPSTLNAKCPCCKVTSSGDINAIEEIFGFRNMGDGKKIAQSYCRKCRAKHCTKDEAKCA